MRALVVGAGRMGMFHRRALRDLGLDVTTVDPDPAAGADCVGVPYVPGGFDVVCVAVPIAHLAEQAARWSGFEGWLLIEKPGAPCLSDARELARLLDGQRVAVGYVERFNPVVRQLQRDLVGRVPRAACFTRWNDRPSENVEIDLRAHDVDLARFLELDCPVSFAAKAATPFRRRLIEVLTGDPRDALTVDLTAHDTSPLHAQWHAFLSGRPGYATPADAVAALAALAHVPERAAA